MYSNETGNALASLVLASYSVSGSLRSDHCNVNVCRRNDAAEVDVEAMSEHEHIAFLKVGLDVLLVESSLLLIVDEDHDDVSLLCSLSSCEYLEALVNGLLP